MQQKPPPIQWLPIFEAAARLSSFKKAAEELCVTPPAVSQQIKVLETYLGVSLFDRSGRKIRLSQAGEFYYRTSKDIIQRHAKGYREFERKYRHPIVQVSAPIFIAQELLIPNYLTFKEYIPNVELRIVTGNAYIDFDNEPMDAALRFGQGDWPDLDRRFISDVGVKIVCSQAYIEQHGIDPHAPLSKQALEAHVLISLYDSLRDWHSFYPDIKPKNRIVCDSYFSAVRAAEEGLGIAVALTPVTNQRILDGRLVSLNTKAVTTDYAYWLVSPKQETNSANIDALYEWISQLFEDLEDLEDLEGLN